MTFSTDVENREKKNRIGRKFAVLLSLITALALMIWGIYGDPTNPPRLSTEQFKGGSLQESLNKIAEATIEGGAPGLVIVVRKDGQETAISAGVANKQTNEAMPINEPLRIGSVSKVYTASVILTLSKEGYFGLDEPISKYLPSSISDTIQNADKATIRQLLNHTAGIPDYYDIRSYLLQDWTQAVTLKRMLPVSARGEVEFSAGEKFSYSNMGYILLGDIAERTTGQTLGALIDKYIQTPLALNNTYYNIKHPENARIHGYGTIFRPWADTYHLWEHSGPDGGIVATASDTAKFLEALTFSGAPMQSIGQQMLETTVTSDKRQEQGLGLMTIAGKNGTRLIGHTGDVFGYQTIAFSLPEESTVFVAQINCDCTPLTMSLIRNIYQAIKAHR